MSTKPPAPFFRWKMLVDPLTFIEKISGVVNEQHDEAQKVSSFSALDDADTALWVLQR